MANIWVNGRTWKYDGLSASNDSIYFDSDSGHFLRMDFNFIVKSGSKPVYQFHPLEYLNAFEELTPADRTWIEIAKQYYLSFKMIPLCMFAKQGYLFAGKEDWRIMPCQYPVKFYDECIARGYL